MTSYSDYPLDTYNVISIFQDGGPWRRKCTFGFGFRDVNHLGRTKYICRPNLDWVSQSVAEIPTSGSEHKRPKLEFYCRFWFWCFYLHRHVILHRPHWRRQTSAWVALVKCRLLHTVKQIGQHQCISWSHSFEFRSILQTESVNSVCKLIQLRTPDAVPRLRPWTRLRLPGLQLPKWKFMACHWPVYQIVLELNHLRRSYDIIAIFNMATISHLGFASG